MTLSFPLTPAFHRDYAFSAGGVPSVGFSSPVLRRTPPMSGFLSSVIPVHTSYGRRKWEALGLAGSLVRSANPFAAAHPHLAVRTRLIRLLRSNTMKANSRASAPVSIPIPKSINGLVPVKQWGTKSDINYCFEETESAIRNSGLVPEGIAYPSASKQSCTKGHRYDPLLKLSRLGDGRLRLKISAARIVAQDAHFRRFIGTLLADFRLSLVKGESA